MPNDHLVRLPLIGVGIATHCVNQELQNTLCSEVVINPKNKRQLTGWKGNYKFVTPKSNLSIKK